MNEIKKEIKEIAKAIGFDCNHKSMDYCEKVDDCDMCRAIDLYTAGYRNVKDKVVLDKEEYDELLCRVPRSEVDRVVDMVEQQVRQETAREVANKLKLALYENCCAWIMTFEEFSKSNFLVTAIDEVAKQYGVEVEE